jgi:hypothetical protein
MLYSWEEINKIYGYPRRIREALSKEEIYKVGYGLYSDTPNVNPFMYIAAKYPYAIITMNTAFFIHNLTDVVPDKSSQPL